MPTARLSAVLLGVTLFGCMPNPDPDGWLGGQTGAASGGSGGASSGGGSGGSSASGGSGGSGGSSSGGSGSGGSGGSGGSSASGGSGGNSGGSSAGSGGATGGRGGTGGAGGAGGSAASGGATGASDARGMEAAAAAGWVGCLEPVFSGVAQMEFCMVYERICTFTGMNHYTSMADCMSKFRGGANDGDACKSGHLCRAATMPAMKEMDCRTAGTAACRN
jgi:hypothetical protein